MRVILVMMMMNDKLLTTTIFQKSPTECANLSLT